MSARRWFFGVMMSSLLPAAAAVDVVVLHSNITLRGEILEYDERQVRIQVGATQRVITHDLSEVKSVTYEQSPAQKESAVLEQKGEYRQAAAACRKALEGETRTWNQRRLRASLAADLYKASDWLPAADEFFKLAQERTDDAVMAFAPLVWSSAVTLPPSALESARTWIKEGRPAIQRLVAASWLTASDAGPARTCLEQLQTFVEPRISLLARAQLWRHQLKEAKAGPVERYRQLIEKMPEEIRSGPNFVLGEALSVVGQPADAAIAYLSTPLVHPIHPELAREALTKAAAACAAAGLTHDADLLRKSP